MGATVSLLVPLLLERGVALDPLEATLAYAGLWEDTGGFSFPSTTPEDLEAAGHLLRQGAEVARVRDWVRPRFGEEAREILSQLLKTAHLVERKGFRLLVARAREKGYVPALAPSLTPCWTSTRRTGSSWPCGSGGTPSSSPGARPGWTWGGGLAPWAGAGTPGRPSPGCGARGGPWPGFWKPWRPSWTPSPPWARR